MLFLLLNYLRSHEILNIGTEKVVPFAMLPTVLLLVLVPIVQLLRVLFSIVTLPLRVRSARQAEENRLKTTGKPKQRAEGDGKFIASALRVVVWRFVVFVAVAVAAAAYLVLRMTPAFDDMMNWVDRSEGMLPDVSKSPDAWQRAQRVHAELAFVADLHADTCMWTHSARGDSLLKRTTYGMIDVPRMREGRLALSVQSSVTKIPYKFFGSDINTTDVLPVLTFGQMWPRNAWFGHFNRVLFYADRLQRTERDSNGGFVHVRTAADLARLLSDRKAGKNTVGAIHGIEGFHALEGREDAVDVLWAHGVRVFGLAHFGDNEAVGADYGAKKHGITPYGRRVIKRLLDLSAVIDLVHASHDSIRDVMDMYEAHVAKTAPGAQPKPQLIYSHGALTSRCPSIRNVPDDLMKRMAKLGGIFGVGFWPEVTCGRGSVDDIADTIVHTVDVLGDDHVGLGSDWDGTVTTPIDASELVYITYALLQRGYTQERVEKIMGGNVLQLLQSSLPR